MSITHTLNFSISSDSGSSPITGSQQETGGSEIVINTPFPAGSVFTPVAVSFSTAGVQSFVLNSKKPMTILVNSTSTPDLTIILTGGEPYIWHRSNGNWANPFPSNVTTLYVSCTPAATLVGKILKA